MANYTVGVDALKRFNGGNSNYEDNKFAKFSSGTEYTVKVLGEADVMSARTYSHFNNPRITTFTAKDPSSVHKDSDGNFVYENPTPWDTVSQAMYDKSKENRDEFAQKGYAVSAKTRYAFGFYDLDAEDFIIIDLTANQAKEVYEEISKHGEKLGQRIFKLSKTGKGTNTKVSLDVVFPGDETDEQKEAFDNAPEEFPTTKFEGLYFEKSTEEMKKDLVAMGYKLEDFGIEPPKEDDNKDLAEDELPF